MRGQVSAAALVSPNCSHLCCSWFPSIFTRLVWAILVSQLTVGAILGLHRFPYAAILFVVFVITLLMWIWADRQLHRHFKYGVVGLQERHPQRWPAKETYQYPALRPPLFHVEEQQPELPETPDYDWWPYEYDGDKAVAVEWIGRGNFDAGKHVGLEEQFELSETALL